MMTGIPSVPGFWADHYVCRKYNVVETINYMLSLHADDFPNTCCVGFTITEEYGLVKVWPKVRYNKGFTVDFLTGEVIDKTISTTSATPDTA